MTKPNPITQKPLTGCLIITPAERQAKWVRETVRDMILAYCRSGAIATESTIAAFVNSAEVAYDKTEFRSRP